MHVRTRRKSGHRHHYKSALNPPPARGSIRRMRNKNFSRAKALSVALVMAAALAVLLSAGARAATWKGLEPFVSKRADVEQALGAPVADRYADDGTLEFKVDG